MRTKRLTHSAGSFSAGRVARKTVSDLGELDPAIDAVLAANAAEADAYRGGKQGVLGFLVRQVMKETRGAADPRVVSERLREKLGT